MKTHFPVDGDTLKKRIEHLRTLMRKAQIDWLLVRSTDDYLNEYVPTDISRRAFISGFTGSMGDALVGLYEAVLFVDGRYAIQAKEEAKCFEVCVLDLGTSIETAWMNYLERAKASRVALELGRVPRALFERVQKALGTSPSQDPHLVDQTREALGPSLKTNLGAIWEVPKDLKHPRQFDAFLSKHSLDAYLLVMLDEIAWATNLRGSDFAYQATFAASALVYPDHICLIGQDSSRFKPHLGKSLRAIEPAELTAEFTKKKLRIGFDPEWTPEGLARLLEAQHVELVPVDSPARLAKSIKSQAELKHVRSAFARADQVVFSTEEWVRKQVMGGHKLTEADVYRQISDNFFASGAHALSFSPICGAGANGAIIHHSTPDAQKQVAPGDLFLLDTGALYEGGYATDLTRTFLVGDDSVQAQPWQKQMYTLVLKASIAGMTARFPKKNIQGRQLDALVRQAIWQQGMDYAHGTGHGIGINVHEFPPRVATFSSEELQIGQVFSIEPGLYFKGLGGVRIENLCTLVQDPDLEHFVRVLPLTFAPLDDRLIEKDLLTPQENRFLVYFQEAFQLSQDEWPPLPPLETECAELKQMVS